MRCNSSGTLPAALLIVLWLVCNNGCALLPQPEVIAPDRQLPPVIESPARGQELFQIDQAELTLHTYRAGWLSALAHNHVMTTSSVKGVIRLAEPIYQSTATLYFRPWDLILDDPATRAAAGQGFESTRSAADIAATRSRMLGPAGFDSNKHPYVVVEVNWVSESLAGLTIRFRDTLITHEVALTWSRNQNQLTVQADFEIDHQELGIKPYSAFAGAIAVAEPVRVQLTLSAQQADPGKQE